MKAIDPTALVYGAPVVLYKSEGYRVLKHNKTAEEFQKSLQVGGSAVKLPKAKPCKICREVKLLEEFSINKSCRDNRINKCKACSELERLKKAAKEREKYKSITREGMDKRNANRTKNYKIRNGLA